LSGCVDARECGVELRVYIFVQKWAKKTPSFQISPTGAQNITDLDITVRLDSGPNLTFRDSISLVAIYCPFQAEKLEYATKSELECSKIAS
jgi:hypothetical protein